MTSTTRPGHDGPPDTITVAGRDLVTELMGRCSFTELIFMLMAPGRTPTEGEARLVDAILVTFADHGVTPSSIVARLTLLGAPEAFQGAVAAGLTGAGSRYLGTMEQTAELLGRIVREAAPDASPAAVAAGFVGSARATRRPIPGVGHPEHKHGDPRTPKLVELAHEGGVLGRHSEVLLEFPGALVGAGGTWLPVNAAGMAGALVADMGFPPAFGRGLAIIARAAGLVGHLLDEQANPTAQGIWDGLR